MAASITRCHWTPVINFSRCNRLLPIVQFKKQVHRYVLVPEYPPDTAETNPLMRYKELSMFDDIQPKNLVSGMAKIAMDAEINLNHHFEQFKDTSVPRTYGTVIEPFNEQYAILMRARAFANILLQTNNSRTSHLAFNKGILSLTSATGSVFSDTFRYTLFKEVYARPDLTEKEKTILEYLIWQFKFHGLSHKVIGAFKQQNVKVQAKEEEFVRNVDLCNVKFVHTIFKSESMEGVPENFKRYLSLNELNPNIGPWKITLEEPVYSMLLQYLPDRQERYNIWYAKNNIAAVDYVNEGLTNHVLLDEIVESRYYLAKNYGFQNYAELKLQNTMASSVENLLQVLDDLKSAYYPIAKQELQDLNEFAVSNGFNDEFIEPHDIPFYAEKQKSQLYDIYGAGDINVGFPAVGILECGKQLCNKLFGVTFKENKACKRAHPSVKVYDIIAEDGSLLTTFYLDIMRRENKEDQLSIVYDHGQYGMKPFYCNSINMVNSGQPFEKSLLYFHNVKLMLYQLGCLMQNCFIKNLPSSVQDMERDGEAIGGYFLSHFAYEPEFMKEAWSYTDDFKITDTDDILKLIYKIDMHMRGYENCQQLVNAAFDVEIHLGINNHFETMENVWSVYMPLKFPEKYNVACSKVEIFQPDGGLKEYYPLWAEMVGMDMYSQFKEIGFNNSKELELEGRRLRDIFFADQKTIPGKELYRRYRLRDPSTIPLQNLHKMVS